MNLIPDNIPFDDYMQENESHRVLPASSFIDDVEEVFYPTKATPRAPSGLWDKMRDKLAFRPCEVTLWAGVNGHGKSMFTSQIQLDLCYQGQAVMSASFEMQAKMQMARMSRQAYAGDYPDKPFLRRFSQWTDGRLWIYDHMGQIEWKKVIAVMRYARHKFGITHFIVDSLMKCVRGEDDYNGQKDFVNDLCAFAQANKVHVHVIHHVRKGESENKCPGKFDIRGASSITDLVDNVVIVWRNKKAEEKNADDPNCLISIEKQRHGDYEGKLAFWFEPLSQQYLEHPSLVPHRYNISGGNYG